MEKMMTKKIHIWTPIEDERLVHHREKGKIAMKTIAQYLSIPESECRSRYQFIKSQRPLWLDDERKGFFDIESTSFYADTGNLLSWAMMLDTGKVLSDCIKPEECKDYKKSDKRIVQSLVDAIQTVDVLIGYYSTGFDVPMVRARALFWGIPFPSYGTVVHCDLYYNTRGKVALTRKSLELCTKLAVGKSDKTRYDSFWWSLARQGHPEALKDIFQHNLYDVSDTRELFEAVKHFSKWQRNSI